MTLVSGPALAAGDDASLSPTEVETSPGRVVAAATATDERARHAAAIVDSTLRETITDLGLSLYRETPELGGARELLGGEWRLSARLSVEATALHVWVTAVAPGSRVKLVRDERVPLSDDSALEVRAAVMLRDVVDAGRAARREPVREQAAGVPPAPTAPPSSGRPVLALTSVVLGGYFGFSIQRTSGSKDTRIVYPLVALGAGLGLGASLLVADEWNVGYGDAWYLAAGALWPGVAGLALTDGYGVSSQNRYAYSFLAALGGVGLATVSVATQPITEGDAVLTHSGGAFGALFGAMTEMAYHGDTGGSVVRGLGWGSLAGVLTLGATATAVEPFGVARDAARPGNEPGRPVGCSAREPALARRRIERDAHAALARERRGGCGRGRGDRMACDERRSTESYGQPRHLAVRHGRARRLAHVGGPRGGRALLTAARLAFVVAAGEAGERLDRLVVKRVPGLGRKRARELFAEGQVTVAGRPVRPGAPAVAGTEVSVEREAEAVVPEPDLPLDVRLELDQVVVVHKPPGQASAPLGPGERGTLANALVARYPSMLGIGHREREPGLLHRLDTHTSGLLVAARTAPAFAALSRALDAERLVKRYLAVVAGALPDEGTIDWPLAPDPKKRGRVAAYPTPPRGYFHEALTRYRVLERHGEKSLVELEVGRAFRHQVRAHLAALGAPLVGDTLYGGTPFPGGGPRHALHASYVAWAGDATVRSFAVAADLPDDLSELLGG